jgi:hypothetical protein
MINNQKHFRVFGMDMFKLMQTRIQQTLFVAIMASNLFADYQVNGKSDQFFAGAPDGVVNVILVMIIASYHYRIHYHHIELTNRSPIISKLNGQLNNSLKLL